jgi:hypothetical protein
MRDLLMTENIFLHTNNILMLYVHGSFSVKVDDEISNVQKNM